MCDSMGQLNSTTVFILRLYDLSYIYIKQIIWKAQSYKNNHMSSSHRCFEEFYINDLTEFVLSIQFYRAADIEAHAEKLNYT